MMNHETTQYTPKIAYLMKCFPRLSETFILHEVLELEQQGLPLRIYSLLPPEGKINDAARDVQATVTYVPRGFPTGMQILFVAALKRFLTSPLLFLQVCLLALFRFHHHATPKHLFLAAYIANQVERDGITHIHAHFANTPTTVALLVHQFTGVSYSFTAHAKDIYLSRKKSLGYKMSKARFVVTCTGYNQQYLNSLESPPESGTIHRIYHGLDLHAFPARSVSVAHSDACPLILSVARLVEKKGLSYLLDACQILKGQGYTFTCRIVGDGELRPLLEQRIRELSLSDCVELWGSEQHERVIEMYQQATLSVLPCVISENGDRDGIPNVLVESLFMGVPIVSTPISGIPELISSGLNGLLVPSRDSKALAIAMARLLDSPSLRHRLAYAGRRIVLEQFDMAHNATSLLHLLQREISSSSIVEDIREESLEAFLEMPPEQVRLGTR
ncbi:MAG: glycosyltransferase [Ktedonobacteraceae bacterium]